MAVIETLLAEGTNNSGTTTDTVSFTASTGRPLLCFFASASSSNTPSSIVLDPSGTPQSFTKFGRGTVATGNTVAGELWYLDAPTTVTAVVRATQSSNSTQRFLQVYEITGHLTSSSTAWRDAPSTIVEVTGGTTHEIVVTSASGDLPLGFVAWRNVSSAPTLTNNGSSTTLASIIAGTTVRGKALTGTGAASVTLGGTTATATNSVLFGININAAASGSSIAAISSVYNNGGFR